MLRHTHVHASIQTLVCLYIRIMRVFGWRKHVHIFMCANVNVQYPTSVIEWCGVFAAIDSTMIVSIGDYVP